MLSLPGPVACPSHRRLLWRVLGQAVALSLIGLTLSSPAQAQSRSDGKRSQVASLPTSKAGKAKPTNAKAATGDRKGKDGKTTAAKATVPASSSSSPAFGDKAAIAGALTGGAAGAVAATTLTSGTAGGTSKTTNGPSANPAAPLLQLGLYSRESDAWYAWDSLQRRQPELTRDLKASVSFLDGKNESSGAVLRATTPGDVDAQRLCRRIVGAGFGCMMVEAPSGSPPSATTSTIKSADAARSGSSTATPAAAAASPPVAAPPPASPPTPLASAVTAALPAPVQPPSAPATPSSLTMTVPMAPSAPAAASGTDAPAKTATAPIPTAPPPGSPSSILAPIASATAAPLVPPPSVMAAVPPLDGTVIYTEEDARTMADIEQTGRTKGRLRSVVPDARVDVMPATLKREGWNLCALTFDDGPHRTVTRQILDVLNREGVRATYFPVGRVAQHQGDLIRDFVASGHEIGNHSLTHSDLRAMPVEAQRFEVAETNRILRSFGANPVLFRPPYGRYSLSLLGVARNEQMNSVLWTVDTRDWKVRNADKIVEHIKTAAGTGSVFLMHSTYPTTAEALPRVIAELRAKGCQFVTLTEWLERMRDLALPKIVNAGMPTPPATNAAPAARN